MTDEFRYPVDASSIAQRINRALSQADAPPEWRALLADVARAIGDRDRALEDFLLLVQSSTGGTGGFPIIYDNGRTIYSIAVTDAFVGSEDLLILKVTDKATGSQASLILNNDYGFPGRTIANLQVAGASFVINSPRRDSVGFDGAQIIGVTFGTDVKVLNAVSGAVTVDLHRVNGVTMTLIGNTTLTFDTTGYGGLRFSEYEWLFYVKQDGTGGRTLTWPTTVPILWAGGSPPVISAAPNALDIISLRTHDEFVEYFGKVVGTGYA